MISDFVFEPAEFCIITYKYSVDSIKGVAAVEFDPVTKTFTFGQDDDLTISGSTFTDYLVTISAMVGDVIQIKTDKTFSLKVKNPCIDSAYL